MKIKIAKYHPTTPHPTLDPTHYPTEWLMGHSIPVIPARDSPPNKIMKLQNFEATLLWHIETSV